MSDDQARAYVTALYAHILRRTPQNVELENWIRAYTRNGPEFVFFAFINSPEYKSKSAVRQAVHPGHYYSPVVDPATVVDYVARERASFQIEQSHIDISIDRMEEIWNRCAKTIETTPFTEESDGQHRFYYQNNIFPYGDAIFLRAWIADLKPKLVMEIGSGFSSACMLDTVDEFNIGTNFVFIDPYAERLKNLLTEKDRIRTKLLEVPVQDVPLQTFGDLQAGDILFIDSTHVLKTGSDVHFELFHILPSLKPGVIIHFHDIQYPFEYPDQWIYEVNYSWNEIYALRAFLMYNPAFRVVFWGSYFVRQRTSLVKQTLPLFLKNPGSSIWVEKL